MKKEHTAHVFLTILIDCLIRIRRNRTVDVQGRHDRWSTKVETLGIKSKNKNSAWCIYDVTHGLTVHVSRTKHCQNVRQRRWASSSGSFQRPLFRSAMYMGQTGTYTEIFKTASHVVQSRDITYMSNSLMIWSVNLHCDLV